MLILLPPSETKRDGGDGGPLDLQAFRFEALTAARRELAAALVSLASDRDATIAALKLGKQQHGEVARNLALTTSPGMPAIDRYTGVLYGALDAPSLSRSAREFAHRHLVVHSALFGPVAALDPIPAYRLSADSRVPGFVLKRHWAAPVGDQLAAVDGFVLDLRSEGYVALGALPSRPDAVFLRVLTEAADGTRRALNHFNKLAKGEFARALLEARVDHVSVDGLIAWAAMVGFRLEPHGTADGTRELALIV